MRSWNDFPGMVAAVTFDFWNTLMWEEPGSLRAKRLEAWAEALGTDLDLEAAHDAAHEGYVDSWTAGRQFRVEEAVELMLERLDGRVPAEGAAVLVEGFSEGGRRAAVHPSDGVHDCLDALKRAGARIGIVCDIGLTPSSVVRELLARYDLLEFFDGMSFSDEVGYYKPDRPIFEHALESVGGVEPSRAAHVGDRLRTDIAGARAMGMIAVLYRGVFEDDSDGPEPDVVVAQLAELPAVLGLVERQA
jgi:FMN phosphatase YigB (HAD superfamily)